jgi:NifU-like protein involved in Fe-S cluster formation
MRGKGIDMSFGKKITVSIDLEGNATIEAHNFHGKGCAAHIKALTDALGGKITEERTKREFFETEQCQTVRNFS